MITREEIHDRIMKCYQMQALEREANTLEILEALNDKLAGIEGRLRGHEACVRSIDREMQVIQGRIARLNGTRCP